MVLFHFSFVIPCSSRNKFLKKLYKTMNFDLHTHKHHIISLQYLQHKWLPEKSSLHCLRIPIMFKDLAVIMKEIIPWLLAWLNLTIPNQTVRNSLKAKNIKLPQNDFFLQKQLIKFSCTYWSPSFCKILKKFLRPIQSYEDVPFSGPKWTICHEQNFLVQTIITFIYLLALLIVQNFN